MGIGERTEGIADAVGAHMLAGDRGEHGADEQELHADGDDDQLGAGTVDGEAVDRADGGAREQRKKERRRRADAARRAEEKGHHRAIMTIAPVERSNWPPMSTTVMPSATMPVMTPCWSTATILLGERKRPETSAAAAITTNSTSHIGVMLRAEAARQGQVRGHAHAGAPTLSASLRPRMIMSITASSLVSAAIAVPTTSPFLRTTTRSARRMTSRTSWLIEENADALLAQLADEGADLGGLVRSERRGRLVHDEQAHAEMDGARDRDRLALAARHLPHGPLDLDEVRVERSERPCRLRRHPLLVEEAEACSELAAEEEVGRRVEIVGERERLVDRLDAVAPRVGGRLQRNALPVDPDLARARWEDAGEDLDEDRLAGAVVADQGDDLAGGNREIDARERPQPAKLLGDPDQLDERNASHCLPHASQGYEPAECESISQLHCFTLIA